MEEIDEIKQLLREVTQRNPYEMFSLEEAAAAFNISRRRLTEALNNQEMPEYRLDNKQRMLRRKDIEKWIDSRVVSPVELVRAKNYL